MEIAFSFHCLRESKLIGRIEQLKRLLLLLPLLLTPAAHAVDYVRCEAMQGALKRTNQQLQGHKKKLKDKAFYQARVEYCGEKPDAVEQAKKYLSGAEDYDPNATISWMRCVGRGESAKLIQARYKTLNQPDAQLKALEARAAKVKADFAAEGCY